LRSRLVDIYKLGQGPVSAASCRPQTSVRSGRPPDLSALGEARPRSHRVTSTHAGRAKAGACNALRNGGGNSTAFA
jgi:hypothetical protein